MSYKYIVDHIPVNTPYDRRPQNKMVAETITIHNTGNPSSTAKNERGWLTNPSNKRVASFHIAIDENYAVECIPLNENAWHAGDGNGKGNMRSIAIEICESGNYEKTLGNAVKLVAKMLKERGWGIDRLRRHWDWSRKICPRLMYDGGTWKSWYNFLERVEKELNNGKSNVNKDRKKKLKDSYHTIEAGDTLWGIAREYKTTVNKLRELNPNVKPEALKIGSKIKVEEVVEESFKEHKIVKGDTLWALAKKYNVTVEELEEVNEGINARALQVGEIIYIPTEAKATQKEQPKKTQKPNKVSTDKIKKYSAPKVGVVTGDVWLHNKPDFTTASRERVLKQGESYKVYGETDDMYMLGGNTYVSKKYMKLGNVAMNKTGYATGDVWLHSKPDFTAKTRTKVLKKGQTVEILASANTSMYKTDKGYVSKKYIRVR